MRFERKINGEEVIFTSVNLCTYGDTGDYELYPDYEMKLAVMSLKKHFEGDEIECLASELLVIVKCPDYEVTFYPSGRCILEQVEPPNHERAFEIYYELLGLMV